MNTSEQVLNQYISQNTHIYKSVVTAAKPYETQSCFIFWCGSSPKETVIFTTSLGTLINQNYTCSYFTDGQNVQITANPIFQYQGSSFSASDMGESFAGIFLGHDFNASQAQITGYTYSVQGIPNGC
jgi:hypothetical protein